MTKENKKEELYFVIGMIAFFGAVLACVDFWYSDWAGMTNTWAYMGLVGAILLHIVTAAAAYIALREWLDYEFNVVRKWFCGFVFATILYVGGFKAAKNERSSVVTDSNQAKQEQAK
jgi:hypothetical protein